MFEAGFAYILSKSLMNTRTSLSIHKAIESCGYSFFVQKIFRDIAKDCILPQGGYSLFRLILIMQQSLQRIL